MNWHKLTLEQYQLLYPIINDPTLKDWEKEIGIVSTLYNLTENQIDSLPLAEYKAKLKACAFLYEPIPEGKPSKTIRGTKGKYKLVYDVKSMPFARYAEAMHFAPDNKQTADADFIREIHRMMASAVIPYKKVLGVWVKGKYDASKHSQYAEDLQGAKFLPIYHACVFFYHLFTLLTKKLQGHITTQLMRTGMTESQALQQHQLLCAGLDGFITQNKLPSMKASLYRQLGIYPPYKPSTPYSISGKNTSTIKN